MLKSSLLLFLLVITFQVSLASPVYAKIDSSGKYENGSISAQKKLERAELKTLKEEYKASRSAALQEFKAQLILIRDERKKQILEKFSAKMNQVNQQRVEHWNKILERLNEILEKIKSIPHGSDVDAKITIAEDKLALAQAAIDAQGAKTYTVSVSSESALKSNAGQAMKGEQSDLRSVVQTLNDAKKAVHDALRALKQEKGIGTPTLTPTLTPSVTISASPSATP